MAVAEEAGVETDIVLYMKSPPDRTELEHIVSILADPVEDLVRKDSQFKKLGLNEDDYVGNPAAVVDLLSQKKALMQRPVVIIDNRAYIGRPKSRIAALLAEA